MIGELKPGDILLYAPKKKSFFGWLIARKTWHRVSHCECFIGNGLSVASRDGIGVNKYPVRESELVAVCRPNVPFNLLRALVWFEKQKGTPYGWADLLNFAGFSIDAKGVVCSPFCTQFLRAGGLDPFNGERANLIAPFMFELSPVFDIYEVNSGEILRRPSEVDSATS